MSNNNDAGNCKETKNDVGNAYYNRYYYNIEKKDNNHNNCNNNDNNYGNKSDNQADKIQIMAIAVMMIVTMAVKC